MIINHNKNIAINKKCEKHINPFYIFSINRFNWHSLWYVYNFITCHYWIINKIFHASIIFHIFKLVSAFFIKILILHQMIALQKLWKMFFISSKKLFSFARYSHFYVFPFLSTLSRLKRTNGTGKIYDVMDCLA